MPEGTRYLKVALEFELTGEKFKELAEERKGRIKDQVIEFLSDLTVDDVVGSDNKQYIKERLLTRLNHSLEGEAGGPVFRRVFFPRVSGAVGVQGVGADPQSGRGRSPPLGD